MNTHGNTGLPTALKPLRYNERDRISQARSLRDGFTIFSPSFRLGVKVFVSFWKELDPLPKTQPEQPTRQISRIQWLIERCCVGLTSEVLCLGDGR